MGICDGRVVIITGAGRGIGREHALMYASEGAKVVVNDLGQARDGTGSDDATPAEEVVALIEKMGGEAIVDIHDISDFAGAEALVKGTIERFGKVDTLVNNAGILRDRMLVNMSEAEWDAVIKVHLKGTFGPAKFACEHWKARSKAGEENPAGRIINTSSTSGIFGNIGQTNYGAAKAGIAGFTVILAQEMARYGVTVNAIAPAALTRLTEDLGMGKRPKPEEGAWDAMDPINIAPLVVWLGSDAAAGVSGRVFITAGGRVSVAEGWERGPTVNKDGLWAPAELGELIPDLVAQAAANSSMRS